MSEKMVKRIPIKEVVLEVSLDGKSASMVFTDSAGKEYILKYNDGDVYKNLDVAEI